MYNVYMYSVLVFNCTVKSTNFTKIHGMLPYTHV